MDQALNDTGWRGSQEGWLEAAYQSLLESGVDSVKILPLAKKLNLSRTSFYWFFKDREELLSALVARWREKNTGNIVKQSEAEEKTKSGILLPDSAKEKPTRGKVIAVGPGKLDDKGKPMEIGLRVGDTVYYGKYSGTDVEIDGQKLVILRESDVLGVLE